MWSPTIKDKYGVAIYNYNGTGKHKLSLNIGDCVQIQEECNGWYKGFLIRKCSVKGIFPASHIKEKDCVVDIEGPDETVTPVEDGMVKEVIYVLREWGIIWRKIYVKNDFAKFITMNDVMNKLMDYMKELINCNLSKHLSDALKEKIATKIDWGNKLLGLDLVPRIDTEQVDQTKISLVELFRIHEKSQVTTNTASFGSIRDPHRSPMAYQPVIRHLHLDCKSVMTSIPDEIIVHFALYDAKAQDYFSERFTACLKGGVPTNLEKLNDNHALFTDLGAKDLMRDAYLIAQVYRKGNIQADKRQTHGKYKRPFGVGVICLQDVFVSESHKEFNIKVESCTEENFPHYHENVIRKLSNPRLTAMPLEGRRESFPFGITVEMELQRGDMEEVKKKKPMWFKGHMAITRKLGFSDVIMPDKKGDGNVRNDFYLTIQRAEFERGQKSASKNVEVTVVTYTNDSIAATCISPGAGEDNTTEYRTCVFYHSNTPHWNDTIKLMVPIDKFNQSHVRLEFRHCSTRDRKERKLFGFAFLPLAKDLDTTISDGWHKLYVYKCEDENKLQNPAKYIYLPSSYAANDPAAGSTHGHTYFRKSDKEFVEVKTLLCSTKLTQNADLRGLLKWRQEPEKISHHLHQIGSLKGEEIVKFLQDILDALFDMLSDPEIGQQQCRSIFRALVAVCAIILTDDKFQHFRPVMDVYIDNFSHTLIGKDLLVCLQQVMDSVAGDEQAYIQKCFKVMDYIMKLVVMSQKLIKKVTPDYGLSNEFRRLLKDLYTSINQVLKVENDDIISTQMCLMANVPKVIEPLLGLVSNKEVAQFMVSFMQSLPENHHASLTQSKLELSRDVVNSRLFECPDAKYILLTPLLQQLESYLSQKEQLKLCSQILGQILLSFHNDHTKNIPTSENIANTLRHLLHVLIDLLLGLEKHHPKGRKVKALSVKSHSSTALIVGLLVADLMALLNLMDDQHYQAIIEGNLPRANTKEFLHKLLKLFHELVCEDVFPKDWMVMKMSTNEVILQTTELICETLRTKFLDSLSFDEKLWEEYFLLAVKFLTQPCLQIEEFSEAKKQKIHEKYKDMRVQMGYGIQGMWDNLGEHKNTFVPSMVGPFLEVTLVPETELRKATLPIFFDMMECDQIENGNFKTVENELIDKLDILIGQNKGDEEYKQLFNSILLTRMKSDPSWKENGVAFIKSVVTLLELLLDYRAVIAGDDNRDKRMTCTVNLLNYYKKEINREDMYIRYIYKLRDLHRHSSNYTEAAFTLQLHAEMLDWDSCKTHPFEGKVLEEGVLKEQLYCTILEDFDKGKAWEYGIPTCKELGEQYNKLVDYQRLSGILTMQASFYDKILCEHRFTHNYFKVGFWGISFPLFLRNKEFVYRGDTLEQLGSFMNRILEQFPGASLSKSNAMPSEDVKNDEKQVIQICLVHPRPTIDPRYLQHTVNFRVRDFYTTNNVRDFYSDRAFHQGTRDKNNEHKTMHLERTRVKTSDTFPGILRWFPVVESIVRVLTPIETAIDAITAKTEELQELVAQISQKAKHQDSVNLSDLTRMLNGIIDPSVNGGFMKYQEAFCGTDYLERCPGDTNNVATLKTVFIQQMEYCREGLNVHGRLVSDELRPLHNQIEKAYKQLKSTITESGSPCLSRVRNSLAEEDEKTSSGSSKSLSSLSSTPRSSGHSSDFSMEQSEHSEDSHSRSSQHPYTAPNSRRESESSQGHGSAISHAPSAVSLDSAIPSLPPRHKGDNSPARQSMKPPIPDRPKVAELHTPPLTPNKHSPQVDKRRTHIGGMTPGANISPGGGVPSPGMAQPKLPPKNARRMNSVPQIYSIPPSTPSPTPEHRPATRIRSHPPAGVSNGEGGIPAPALPPRDRKLSSTSRPPAELPTISDDDSVSSVEYDTLERRK